ncbi:MAG TPA: hypothetical protein VKJ01_19935 [Candidatus Solibacter sp.]|nr:hypothetical protein [Candidatus Solibacter sp.]
MGAPLSAGAAFRDVASTAAVSWGDAALKVDAVSPADVALPVDAARGRAFTAAAHPAVTAGPTAAATDSTAEAGADSTVAADTQGVAATVVVVTGKSAGFDSRKQTAE